MWLSGDTVGRRDQSGVAGGGEFWTRAVEQPAAGIVTPSLVAPGKGLSCVTCACIQMYIKSAQYIDFTCTYTHTHTRTHTHTEDQHHVPYHIVTQ